ncbi:MAG: HI0074 family nucleotidyltransferase substrate-binding subunit [Candidatus Omnitrophota bacterium]|nr:nucleotidyltransferase substrate binding protein [Candidatus Omnitrophota bacterium]
MKDELEYSIVRLENALSQLKSGCEKAQDELEEDGVIQRFEFTFELFWKTLKVFLRKEGIEARTPRDVFKEAFKLEWFDVEEIFLNMLEDRNKTSHIYDNKTSREIFERVKEYYVFAIEKVTIQLKSKIA